MEIQNYDVGIYQITLQLKQYMWLMRDYVTHKEVTNLLKVIKMIKIKK